MNLKDRVGKLFMIGLPSTSLDDETKRVLDEVRPGSIILFSRNIESKEQVKKYIQDITEYLGYKPLVTIDQEGGIVTRLIEGFCVAPGTMAAAATQNPESAYKMGKILGKEMKAIGVDWDLAPVVDINNNPNNPGIGVRSFSSDKNIVVNFAQRFIDGLEEEGIIACLKHFPGKGRVAVDAHLDMPELNISKEKLMDVEIYPFKNIDSVSWMPSHIYIPCLQDKKEPATVSKSVLTTFVREELEYKGVLIADDLSMGGVSNYYTPKEAAELTFRAGMDILSFCHDSEIQISVKKYMEEKIENDEELRNRMEESLERLEKLYAIAKVNNNHPLEEVGTEDNNRVFKEICENSITVYKNEDAVLPLDKVDNVFTVKLTRLVLVEDKKEGVPEISKRISERFDAPLTIFDPKDNDEKIEDIINKAKGKINIVLTENAHLYEGQKKVVEEIAKNSDKMILVALRNPYDVFIEGVKNSICTYGYTKNQQETVLELLEGKINAKGKIPVDWRMA
ncbi:beta-N-acetylhexosaminidase [Oceanotoga sp. DSM 15011]|uniref:beta-N-acetylhexosaminidase n=1 Tax=Oceanotoga TaxID=1255275 RepID=UPI0021F463F3|nr:MULTISPECIES: beta-N-acetylhexosaminidase [Oceanotoga]MDO7976599.1 beta-N-acetylhexosaminidase [Oceanotoga teriensis]UYO99316.1 beta-N-acetylhexosaminidase [Oceanotoga sp. DSM 15011]